MSDDYDFIIPTIPEETTTAKQRFPVTKQLIILAVFLGGIFTIGASATLLATGDGARQSAPQSPAATATVQGASDSSAVPLLTDISLTASSAFVLDVSTQRVLYSKNPDEVRPIASITKLMTTLVAHELVTGDTWIRIPQAASVLESTSGLVPGQLLTQSSLRDFAMMSSSNDAAHSIATAVGALIDSDAPINSFVAAMNIKAEELNLPSLVFQNTTGLDTSRVEAGAVGTARDVSFLLQYILQQYPEILEPTVESSTRIYTDTGTFYEARNTNRELAYIPQVLGSKTGYTDLAGGNLTIAFDAGYNRPIIITVLGSTFAGRFDDVAKLVAAVRESINSETE